MLLDMEAVAKLSVKSEKSAVEEFLEKMKSILESEDFNMERDFVFQELRKKDEPEDPYTNVNTLLALNFDTSDVVKELKKLTVENYCESVVDNVAEGFNVFYVFGRRVKKRDVYIKVRLKRRVKTQNEFVFCISFHFARRPITVYPYKKRN